VGNGFLKQMNRHLIASLWKLGSGKISMDEFKSYISGPKIIDDLWKVAPPNGLFLYKINY
jgi:tRNA pseudouridine38-40 synthase